MQIMLIVTYCIYWVRSFWLFPYPEPPPETKRIMLALEL